MTKNIKNVLQYYIYLILLYQFSLVITGASPPPPPIITGFQYFQTQNGSVVQVTFTNATFQSKYALESTTNLSDSWVPVTPALVIKTFNTPTAVIFYTNTAAPPIAFFRVEMN